jgi:hypothetical protein
MRPPAKDRGSLPGEPPSQVQVTILTHPGGLTAGSWLRVARCVGRSRVVGSLAAIATVAAGTIGAAKLIDGTGAAPGFPVRCVSVTIALHDPRFLRAAFDRALPCERAGARYANAATSRSQ